MADTTLIFGDSGVGKTTNLGFAAKYLYESTGLPGRLISSDGGGWKPIQPLIDAGIIDPFRVVEVRNPLVVIRKLSVGYWPDKLKQGIWTGTKLLPPPDGFASQIGWYLIEGLTSMSDIALEDLRDKQRRISEEAVGKFQEEDEKFAANCRAHYNFAQREVMARLKSFAALPVHRVLLSAHEAKGEDEDTKSPIRGPGLAGKAATDKVAKEVGDCIHFESYSQESTWTDPETKQKFTTSVPVIRAYFRAHPDPVFPKIMYKCKPRVPPEQMGELLKRWPGGFFTPGLAYGGGGLDDFLRFEDELLARAANQETEWKTRIDAQRKAA